MKEKKKRSGKEVLVQIFKLPRDVVCRDAILTVTGKKEIFIENVQKLVVYTNEQIVVQGKTEEIHLEGKELQVVSFVEAGMKITGTVNKIFLEARC